MLARNYQYSKRFDAAEALYRAILRVGARHADVGFRAQTRVHLADTLEALGRPDEAQAERKLAASQVKLDPETFTSLHAAAKMLEHDQHFDEAYLTYERALAAAPRTMKKVRLELVLRLAVTATNAGRPADCLRWAVAALEIDPTGPLNTTARTLAANASESLGRLDDAQRYAHAAAERATTPARRAQALAQMADYVMRRGDLAGAERIAREAEAQSPGEQQFPWVIISNVAMHRGEYVASIEAAERTANITEGHVVATQRRARAGIQLHIASLHAELGRLDHALDLLRVAEAEFAGDLKMSVMIDVVAARVHALRHEPEIALERIAATLENRARLATNVAIQRLVVFGTGRAALALGDAEQAEAMLRAYLELKPDPLFHPAVYYHLALCCQIRSDTDAERELLT